MLFAFDFGCAQIVRNRLSLDAVVTNIMLTNDCGESDNMGGWELFIKASFVWQGGRVHSCCILEYMRHPQQTGISRQYVNIDWICLCDDNALMVMWMWACWSYDDDDDNDVMFIGFNNNDDNENYHHLGGKLLVIVVDETTGCSDNVLTIISCCLWAAIVHIRVCLLIGKLSIIYPISMFTWNEYKYNYTNTFPKTIWNLINH